MKLLHWDEEAHPWMQEELVCWMENLFQMTCQEIPGADCSPPSLMVRIFRNNLYVNRDTGMS